MSNKMLSTSFGNIELKVTPEAMYQVADSINKKVDDSKRAFEEMLSIIKSTSSYWEGSAAEQGRSLFENEKDNFVALISNLKNYSTELRSITSIYVSSETVIKEDADSLPTNILR